MSYEIRALRSKVAIPLAAAIVGTAGLVAARRVANAPPDPKAAARARAAEYAGPWTQGHAEVNGLRLHFVELGSGPLLMLLHGFPECWYAWHSILPRLGEHFRVVAPDMRGFNGSDKPQGIAAYTLDHVAEDIVALVRHLGEERAYIAGHDWGGSVAWYLGMHHREHVSKLAVINAPHPAIIEREFRRWRQIRRSLYVLFFQLPLLPEASMRLAIRNGLRGSARVPGAFSDEALDVYENGISQPGAATAMINYYRAAVRIGRLQPERFRLTVGVPTLVIWGMKDFALAPYLLDGLEEWVPGVRVERVEESGHWVPEEKPALVGDLLAEFLSK